MAVVEHCRQLMANMQKELLSSMDARAITNMQSERFKSVRSNKLVLNTEPRLRFDLRTRMACRLQDVIFEVYNNVEKTSG